MKIAEVIKWDTPGTNDVLIHKYESEDFNTLSQLIVHEWQEAILFKDGQALDVFGPGRYTLHTKNVPIIGRLMRLPTEGVSPFHCEIYFINKRLEHMGLLWGVGDIFMQERGCRMMIGAHGEINLTIENSRKLLEKMLGADSELTLTSVQGKLKVQFQMHIKNSFAQEINSLGISIFDLEQYMVNIASLIMVNISPTADDYGLAIGKFSISGFNRPESDPDYMRLRRLISNEAFTVAEVKVENSAVIERKKADIESKRMDIDLRAYEALKLNYSKSQERMYDVMQKLAENEGSGSNLRNDLLGLGMGFGMAAPVGGLFTSIVNGTMNPSLLDGQPGDGAAIPGGGPAGPSGFGGSGGIPPMIDIKVAPSVSTSPLVPDPTTGATPDVTPSGGTPENESSYCPKCGKSIPGGNSFCGKCGANLRSTPRCSNCGEKMDADDLFCGKCGHRREET